MCIEVSIQNNKKCSRIQGFANWFTISRGNSWLKDRNKEWLIISGKSGQWKVLCWEWTYHNASVKFELSQIPREENRYIDTLLKLASMKDVELFKIISMYLLVNLSVSWKRKESLWIQGKASGMEKVILYLKDGTLSN